MKLRQRSVYSELIHRASNGTKKSLLKYTMMSIFRNSGWRQDRVDAFSLKRQTSSTSLRFLAEYERTSNEVAELLNSSALSAEATLSSFSTDCSYDFISFEVILQASFMVYIWSCTCVQNELVDSGQN